VQRSSRQGMDLYRLQADDISAGVSHEVTQQNIKFVDAGLQRVVSAPPIGGFAPNQDDGNRLGDFMSRPVLINSFTWSETNTTVPQTNFNPWKLYFNDVSIKKKLENYKLLRCKMKLKFVVNASPFFLWSHARVVLPNGFGAGLLYHDRRPNQTFADARIVFGTC